MSLDPPDPALSDGDLVLRPPEEGDVPWIVRGCIDPEVSRWTTVPSPYDEGHARAFVADAAVDWRQGTTATFAILLDGEGAALITLRRREPGTGEIGYWVGSWARRRKVATRAGRLVCDWAFATLGLERLTLDTMPGNLPSEGVAAALGFAKGPLVTGGLARGDRAVDVYRWECFPPPG